MNAKLIAISAGVAVLLLSALGFGLAKLGYLDFVLGPTEDEAQREKASRLHSGVTPSSKDMKVLVRQLIDAHDRAAKGDREAAHAANALGEEIADRFEKFEAADWRDRRNYQSMMTYVLVGGNTEVIGSFLKSKVATSQQRAMAKGVLSFTLNRPKTALKLIGDVDPRTVDAPLAAPLSLALASLKISEDPERGVALFDEARLQAPDTAVEEAAMRREIPLLFNQKQLARAMQLTSRYVRRFGRSPYSPGFYYAVAENLVASDIVAPKPLLASFNASVETVEPDIKTELFLTISREALLRGKRDLAKEAAALASPLNSEASPAGARAKLFAAAADAPSDLAQSALATLESIRTEQLEPDDLEIRNAAHQIAGSVVGADATGQPPAEAVTPVSYQAAETTSAGKPSETSTIIDRVGKALKHVDGILSGAEK